MSKNGLRMVVSQNFDMTHLSAPSISRKGSKTVIYRHHFLFRCSLKFEIYSKEIVLSKLCVYLEDICYIYYPGLQISY